MSMKLADLASSTSAVRDPNERKPTPSAPQPASAKEQAMRLLYDRLGPRLASPRMTEQELMSLVASELNSIVSSLPVPLTPQERQQLMAEIVDDTMGLGPLEELIADESISEVMVNAADKVWVERAGKLHLSNIKFENDEALLQIIERIVTRVGRRIDDSSPFVDARLADGSRRGPRFHGDRLVVHNFSRFRHSSDRSRLQPLR